ncbi:MAG: flavodoxin family protein [Thermodesulfobacteriota bacterium]|nr:flavodoxin family protein [Thermodesulfobacteriota bacterium]
MNNTKKVVVYDSVTNNTSLVAKSIAEVLDCQAVPVADFSKLSTDSYDLVVMGSPVLSGKPTNRIINLLEILKTPERCAVFCTYGAPVWGLISSRMTLKYMKRRINAPCLGKFSCPGLHAKLKTYKNRPDDDDFKKARAFAERIDSLLVLT